MPASPAPHAAAVRMRLCINVGPLHPLCFPHTRKDRYAHFPRLVMQDLQYKGFAKTYVKNK
jgi:hypothetical protein